MVRIAIPLLVLLAGCERAGGKKAPPAPVTRQQPKPTAPAVKAPATVPQDLADRIAREWPTIEKEGNLFVERFNEASKARTEGDRAAMAVAVKAAQKHITSASDAWAEIYYSVDDYPEATAEACRKFMRSQERMVRGWMEKAKALAQFSTAK